MKRMNLSLLIFIFAIVLSFCHFNNSYFLMCFPLFAVLLSYKKRFSLMMFLGMLAAALFIGLEASLISILISFGVCYLLIYLLNRTNLDLKVSLSLSVAIASFVLCTIQYNTSLYSPAINILIAPILLYFVTYNVLDIQSDLNFKEKFSIDKKQTCFLAVLANIIFASTYLPFFSFEFKIFFSNIVNAIFVMLNPIAGVIGCVTGLICNLGLKIGLFIMLIPLMLLFKFVNKNRFLKISVYLLSNIFVSIVINEGIFLLESILSALIVVLIPHKLIAFIEKYILEEQDHELKLFKESYYRCLNRNKKVQKAILFLENQIKESVKIKDASMKIIRKDMQFLSDKLKEDDNFRLKENILKRFEFLNLKVIGFKISWDYFYNYKIHLKIKDMHISCEKVIENMESILGVKLKIDNFSYNSVLNINSYYIVNYQASKVNIEIKQRSKELNCCGDSYLSFGIKDKTYFLISDGMGHGKKANKLSSEALLLLKEFIELGMDVENAIISCNTILYCRGEEQFNTLDLLEYDFFNDKINLYKNGSGCTYLKIGNKVEKINSNNLPLGIVEEIKVKKESVDMKWEKIILTSDGFKKDLSSVISKNKSDKDKELIDDVLDFSGNVIDDDQTIVVISVIKN